MNGACYPGGKGLSFRKIINLIPPHDVYIETHLGGGAVLRNKKPSKHDIGIDLDSAVIRSWKSQFGDQYDVRVAHAHQFLREYSFSGSEVVYVDPPYMPDTRRRSRIYRHEYGIEDHKQLLDILVALPCRVILSGYAHRLYDDALASWSKVTYNAQTQSGIRTECLWLNFDMPEELHDSRYIGEDFRERERVRRKLSSLQRKMQALHPFERQAFLEWLKENYSADFRQYAEGGV